MPAPRRIAKAAFVSLWLFAVASAVPALACWECVEQALGMGWSPVQLAKTERGIRVRIHRNGQPYDVADVTFAGDQQRFVKPADQPAAKRSERTRTDCRKRVPYQPPDRKTAMALRPHLRVGGEIHESVGPCVERDGRLWFGLTFYEGEGEDGIGGIGRFDPASTRLEVRRPEWLRDKSVDALAFDGERFWLAVSQHYEHGGPAFGLAQYDWDRDRIVPLTGTNAPCGAHVSDVLLDGNILLVTTELALSRFDLHAKTWSHRALARDGSRFMPVDCRALYRRVVEAAIVNFNNASCPALCEEDEQIPEQIARFDPDTVHKVLFSKPIPANNFAALQAAGAVARDVAELQRYAAGQKYAIDRFAERRPRDPAWPAFALAWAKKSGNIEHLRHLRGDAAVFDFLASLSTGSSRTAKHAIEMLPWIDSRRAIPILVDLVAHMENEEIWSAAVEALERAAHLRIEADGSRTPLAADSDTPEYADEEFGAFHRYPEKDPAGTRKIAALWQEWARQQGIKSPPVKR